MERGRTESLPFRTLDAGRRLGLQSGQALARSQGLKPIHQHEELPIWLYILEEADKLGDGNHLGPLASRIILDVIYSQIESRAGSVLRTNWNPPSDHYGIFDLLQTGWQELSLKCSN